MRDKVDRVFSKYQTNILGATLLSTKQMVSMQSVRDKEIKTQQKVLNDKRESLAELDSISHSSQRSSKIEQADDFTSFSKKIV